MLSAAARLGQVRKPSKSDRLDRVVFYVDFYLLPDELLQLRQGFSTALYLSVPVLLLSAPIGAVASPGSFLGFTHQLPRAPGLPPPRRLTGSCFPSFSS